MPRPFQSQSEEGGDDDWIGDSSESEDDSTVQAPPVMLNVLCRLCCHLSLWTGSPTTCSYINQPHRMYLDADESWRSGLHHLRPIMNGDPLNLMDLSYELEPLIHDKYPSGAQSRFAVGQGREVGASRPRAQCQILDEQLGPPSPAGHTLWALARAAWYIAQHDDNRGLGINEPIGSDLLPKERPIDVAEPENTPIIHGFFSYVITDPEDVLAHQPLFEGAYHFPVRQMHHTLFLRTHTATTHFAVRVPVVRTLDHTRQLGPVDVIITKSNNPWIRPPLQRAIEAWKGAIYRPLPMITSNIIWAPWPEDHVLAEHHPQSITLLCEPNVNAEICGQIGNYAAAIRTGNHDLYPQQASVDGREFVRSSPVIWTVLRASHKPWTYGASHGQYAWCDQTIWTYAQGPPASLPAPRQPGATSPDHQLFNWLAQNTTFLEE